MGSGEALVAAGFLLVFIGVALIFMGVLASALKGGGKGEFGGVIVIGPVPVVFGSSAKAAIVAAVLALALMVLALILMRQAGATP